MSAVTLWDQALSLQQQWLYSLSFCFRTASALPSPLVLVLHFLYSVWVVKGWGLDLTLDRDQAKTKDWLKMKTLGYFTYTRRAKKILQMD